MSDLIAFVRARLDEDEQAARIIMPGGYEPDVWRIEPSRSGRWTQVVAYSRMLGEPLEALAREDDQAVALVQNGRNEHLHIARHDPARVLWDVEAKRRLLEQFRLRGDSVRATVQPATGGVWDDLLRMLALPYADHPDYDERWRL